MDKNIMRKDQFFYNVCYDHRNEVFVIIPTELTEEYEEELIPVYGINEPEEAEDKFCYAILDGDMETSEVHILPAFNKTRITEFMNRVDGKNFYGPATVFSFEEWLTFVEGEDTYDEGEPEDDSDEDNEEYQGDEEGYLDPNHLICVMDDDIYKSVLDFPYVLCLHKRTNSFVLLPSSEVDNYNVIELSGEETDDVIGNFVYTATKMDDYNAPAVTVYSKEFDQDFLNRFLEDTKDKMHYGISVVLSLEDWLEI